PVTDYRCRAFCSQPGHNHLSTQTPAIRLQLFFLLCCVDLLDLHSFPTRRSSDLSSRHQYKWCFSAHVHDGSARTAPLRQAATARSEEHTSELQSPYDLVCRLLLEKKNRR